MQGESANLDKGRFGETKACEYLKAQGFQIKERNFRVAVGEIDIIAKKDGIFHCFEVKTRYGDAFGGPFAALTSRKRQKIRKVAEWYFIQKGAAQGPCLFGAIGVDISCVPPKIECILDAFE